MRKKTRKLPHKPGRKISPAPMPASPRVAPALLRRLAAMVYEGLLLFGVLVGGFFVPQVVWSTFRQQAAPNWVLWSHLFLLLMLYCVWFWTHGGQTLALKTWKMKIVDRSGRPLRLMQAVLRYLVAWPSVGCFGLGLLWALFDPEKQFLHDRIAETRIVAASAEK
ncbi:MAG: RDD family protein [Zoogloeaceae bacterium]|nr:RDD family protein [Zoogloeaceae bacterium]